MASFNVKVLSTYNGPTAFGKYILNPGQVYTEQNIDFAHPDIIGAIQKGDLVFTDTNTVTSFLNNVTVSSMLLYYGQKYGKISSGQAGFSPSPTVVFNDNDNIQD